MRRRGSSTVRSTVLYASMLMAPGCSTVPVPTPIAGLPASLLTEPAELPPIPRSADGTVSGGQCLVGMLDLYTAAGAIRLQLLAVIAAERMRPAR